MAKEVMPAKGEKKNHTLFLLGSAITAWNVDNVSIFERKCLKIKTIQSIFKVLLLLKILVEQIK